MNGLVRHLIKGRSRSVFHGWVWDWRSVIMLEAQGQNACAEMLKRELNKPVASDA